jgi:transcriptional regulator with XRE-family HTH domain
MSATSDYGPRAEPELLGFGVLIKRHRESAGLNQAELARLVNVARSYVSHVERGRTRCRRDFAMRLDKALNAGGEIVGSWEELLESIKASKYPKFFVNFPKAEASAVMLRGYETTVVYGLFQTEAYARHLLPDEEAFKSRMRRQAILEKNPRPVISVVMDETVLYREVGGKETMREQLKYLAELSHWERIIIQLAPVAYYRGVWTPFAIATQPDQRQVVYTDKAYGGETSTGAEEIRVVTEAFVTLQSEALSVKDTRTLIRKVIDERWT